MEKTTKSAGFQRGGGGVAQFTHNLPFAGFASKWFGSTTRGTRERFLSDLPDPRKDQG